MSPLPLTALLLALSPWAQAQTRVGAVEAGAGNAGASAATVGTSLPAGSAPQLLTLDFLTPSFSPTPGATPLALSPSPVVQAAAFAPSASVLPVTAARAVVPPALPASAIALDRAPQRDAPAPGALLSPGAEEAPRTEAEMQRLSDDELIGATKKMFGESTRPGYQTAEYLRPGAPFQFASEQVARYQTALGAPRAKSGTAELATLVDAAAGLAASAGIVVKKGERADSDGVMEPILTITPLRDGHRLNRLAWDLRRTYDSSIEYAPGRLRGAVAAYNSTDRALFLPDFGRDDAFEAILHESRHAAFAKRLRRGEVSVFHPALVAYPGRIIAPGASSYDTYMSMEELSTHAKTLLHEIVRSQREPAGSGPGDARTDSYQLADILRTSEINLFQVQRLLERGSLSPYRLTGNGWPDIPGGHWEAINLPHSILVLPVLDEAAAPKRGLLRRLLQGKPEAPALKAARRHAALLRPLVGAMGKELRLFQAALEGDTPDLAAARLSALRLVALADRADKSFPGAR